MVKTLSNQVLKINENAQSFRLKGVDGKIYSLEEFNPKCTLVVFICNHCPYVKARINDLTDLLDKFSTSELRVIGINSNDPNYQEEGGESRSELAAKCAVSFAYVVDETGRVAEACGAVCTRDPFLFD